jgi:hypothetical protein
MTDDRSEQDARFTDEMLALLPSASVPPALEARILSAFDRVAAQRAPGALSRLLQGWRDAVWPGAPVWKPASLLALSLAIGVMAGVLLPSSELASSSTTTASPDQQYTDGDAPPVVNMAGDL